MDEAARAEVHAVLLLALAPERDADVADAHRLGHLRAPALLEPRAEDRLAAARLARDEDALDGRRGEVDPAVGGPLDQVGGVRGREHDRLRAQQLDGRHQALGVPDPDRDVAEADPLERGERRARDERAGRVRRDDPLARLDPGGRVAARGARHPVVEVARGQRDVAGRARRPARRVDADDLAGLGAEVRADRVLGSAARAELGLVGQRQLRRSSSRPPFRAGELLAVERRALEQVGELRAVALAVEGELLVPGAGLDLGLEDHALVLDRVLGRGREQEADRLLLLLGEVREEARRPGEDRDGLRRRRREAEVEQHRGDRHRDVHRQRLAPDLGDGVAEAARPLDVRRR